MKQILAIVVMLSFCVTSSTLAAGPIEESAKRGAEEFAERFAQQNDAQPRSSGRALTWGGVGLMGTGVALIIAANTVAAKSGCSENFTPTSFSVECFSETNNGLAWAGLAAAGLGVGLAVVGIRKNVQVGVSPTAVRLSVKF